MSTKILRTTVTGSYPRPQQPGDTLRKPALSRAQADELIRWAVTDQVNAGLDVVTDGEGRRENMYYFFQKRLDGVSFAEMEYRKYGPLGFGIEIAKVVSSLENPHFELARDWKVARDAAPAHVDVKLTCTGPHMLAKFSNNARTDLYPTDRHLAEAYAALLNDQLKEAVRAGCELIQFGKPAYTTRYQDLAAAFRVARLDQVCLEHCTLSYDMMTLWDMWDFKGEFAVGVIDQRNDAIESVEEIARRAEPVRSRFPPERLLLTSECGFQHVPLEITRAKLRALVAGARYLRASQCSQTPA